MSGKKLSGKKLSGKKISDNLTIHCDFADNGTIYYLVESNINNTYHIVQAEKSIFDESIHSTESNLWSRENLLGAFVEQCIVNNKLNQST
jgi:hypothetical protein